MGTYLCLHVVEGGGADDGEADEENVCLWVGEGSEAVVVFLSRGIPEPETYGFVVDHDACGIVVEAGMVIKNVVGRFAHNTYTVGMYSPGKALVVYDMSRHV